LLAGLLLTPGIIIGPLGFIDQVSIWGQVLKMYAAEAAICCYSCPRIAHVNGSS
jgi:hypothetical protein